MLMVEVDGVTVEGRGRGKMKRMMEHDHDMQDSAGVNMSRFGTAKPNSHLMGRLERETALRALFCTKFRQCNLCLWVF